MRRLAALLLCTGCVSLDTSQERPYPCTADGDCRGSWVCGLERTCHPPEPGPWLCAADAGSALCFGWHCGLEGRCYSKEEGVARPCDFAREQDGGRDDCPMAFRCGRENTCHARGDLRAWQCLRDLDCEGSWRCGPQGICVDPASEQPVLSAMPPLAVERLSPRLLRARPDRIVGAVQPLRRTYGWLNGLDLICLEHTPGAVSQLRDPYQLKTIRLPGMPPHFAASDRAVWVGDDTRLTALSFADGGLVASTFPLDFPPRVLRSGVDGLWVMGDVDLALFPSDGGARVRLDAGLTAGETLVDLDTVQAGSLSGTFLLSSARLLGANPLGVGEVPLFSAPDGSFAITPAEARRVWIVGGVLVLMNADAGAAGHQILATGVVGRAPLCTVCQGLGAPLRPLTGTDPAALTWLCESADGGVTRQTLDAACGSTARVEHARYSRRGDLAWADPYGRLGSGVGSGAQETLGSLTAPLRGGFVSEGSRLLGGSNVASLLLYDAGMVVAGTSSVIGEPVVGGPSLVVTASSATTSTFSAVSDFIRPLRGISPTPNAVATLLDPSVGTPGPGALLSDGSRQLLIAANGDTLFSGDVTDALAMARDGGASVFGPVLQPRLAPSARLPVLSVRAQLSAPDAGHVLSGWALTTNRAVYFEAVTDRSWVDTPVTLPAGDWVTLLGERGALRVAYSDGQLLTLPSRLAVAEPFGSGVTTRQFASAGGVDFALTPAGLHYVVQNPDAGPRGVWRAVPLDSTSAEPGYSDSFDGGRLVEADGHVFVLSTEWGLWRITPDAGR